MSTESWAVPDGHHKSKLLVSNFGNVKTKWRGGWAKGDHRDLGSKTPGSLFNGKYIVSIDNKKYWVDQLVINAFIGPRPTIEHVLLHKDGNLLNNHVSNLSWEADFKEFGEWRQVPGIPRSQIIVSDMGFIRVFDKSAHWSVERFRGPPKLGTRSKQDRYTVSFDKKTFLVHRLVAFAFHGLPPSSQHTVDHIDRNALNNRASNLRWALPEVQANNKGEYQRQIRADSFEDQGNIELDEGVEEWKVAECSGGNLLVSSAGRIHRKIQGKWQRKYTPMPTKNHGGYVFIRVGDRKYCLHRLIALAFLGPSNNPDATTVDHINNVRHDNRLCNLRWATKTEQALNTVRGKRKRTAPDL